MAVTLIINPGSTSKKFALYRDGACLLTLRFEETGEGFSMCEEQAAKRGHCMPITRSQYDNALSEVVSHLVQQKCIASEADIETIGVRVVAPGVRFQEHALVDDAYVAALAEKERFAPLHVPNVLLVIKKARTLIPQAKIIGVSDSAFHATIPPHVREYSLPRKDVEEFELRRYGYHGISVASTVGRLKELLGFMPERVLVCHIGGGVSVTGLLDGESIETSMGFAPASGLMMSGRAGDVDAGAFINVMNMRGLRGSDAHTYLNNEGGFNGVAGVKDLRLILKQCSERDAEAQLALDMFVHQFTKIVGGYHAVLGGLDAIVLTATAAFRNPELRARLLSKLEPLGIALDSDANEALINREGLIHRTGSPVRIGVLKTDEMGEMARVVAAFSK